MEILFIKVLYTLYTVYIHWIKLSRVHQLPAYPAIMAKSHSHVPVTLCTQRYCFLVHSVLGEVVNKWGTGSCTQQWLCVPGDIVSWVIRSERSCLHSLVALHTQRQCFLGYSVLREVVSLHIAWGTGYCTHQYPKTMFPELSGPEGGC